MSDWPSVGVVVPTKNRPRELREALAAVFAQDYPGELEAVVVYDWHDPDVDLAAAYPRIRVLTNSRTPGLAGARNTGILALETDLVAFCDDDDLWLPGKLRAQVEAMQRQPAALMASCDIIVDFGGHTTVRSTGSNAVTYLDLLRSRVVSVHSSTYLLPRAVLTDRIGLMDESIPGGQNEDWDLALRAAHCHPIVCVNQPLVRVRWSRQSHFSRQWESRAEGLEWILIRYPEIAQSPVGVARVYGQLAFAHACLGKRGEACRWAWRAAKSNWREPRAPISLAVAAGVISGDTVMNLLHSRGHGI